MESRVRQANRVADAVVGVCVGGGSNQCEVTVNVTGPGGDAGIGWRMVG